MCVYTCINTCVFGYVSVCACCTHTVHTHSSILGNVNMYTPTHSLESRQMYSLFRFMDVTWLVTDWSVEPTKQNMATQTRLIVLWHELRSVAQSSIKFSISMSHTKRYLIV